MKRKSPATARDGKGTLDGWLARRVRVAEPIALSSASATAAAGGAQDGRGGAGRAPAATAVVGTAVDPAAAAAAAAGATAAAAATTTAVDIAAPSGVSASVTTGAEVEISSTPSGLCVRVGAPSPPSPPSPLPLAPPSSAPSAPSNSAEPAGAAPAALAAPAPAYSSSVGGVAPPPPRDARGGRRSGRPFEAHAGALLRARAAQPAPPGAGPLDLALAGATVHAPWADVPAAALAAIGFEPRDAHERRRVFEGSRERRGFREYGGDALLVCAASAASAASPAASAAATAGRSYVVVQMKDHKRLSLGCLGTFLAAAFDVAECNSQSAGLPQGAPSALLVFPSESRISQRDHVHLRKFKRRAGLHLLGVDDFAPLEGQDPEDAEQVPDDEPMVELQADAVVAMATAAAQPVARQPGAQQPRPESPGGSAEAAAAAEHDEAEAAYAAARPAGGQDRRFQRAAADAVVRERGLHLIKAPPGCGKTAIMATVVGRLVVRQHATRAGKQRAGAAVAFAVAPLIDHVRQLLERLGSALGRQLGRGWRESAVLVADNNVPTAAALLARLRGGARLFVSTDASAHLLLEVARAAKAGGHQVVVCKDEAHYNSSHEAASTRLLALVDPAAGDVGVACTATPDADVLALPGLRRTLSMGIDEAVSAGFCAPYEVILPSIVRVDDGLPVEARALASEDHLGCCALFLVGGMLRDGARRCIAYARDTAEAEALRGFLERACAFHGVGCVATLVVERTRDRQRIYHDFQTGATWEHAVLDEQRGSRAILRFLCSVAILDACVDLLECDSVCIARPPATFGDVKSAHRAIQRLGRATRPKGGRTAFAYVFTDLCNQWLQNLFDVLRDFDPGCRRRVRVRTTNPVMEYTEACVAREHTQIDELVRRFNVDGSDPVRAYTKEDQIAELARLVRLVVRGADDPNTAAPAKMPVRSDERLGLGELWSGMKNEGRRLAELKEALADDDVDVDAFIASQKRQQKPYTAEDQITELKRLVLLVVRGADDPNTAAPAKMPVRSDERLGLGELWSQMKNSEGRRLAELKEALADDDVDVDAFVASQKRQQKPYTAEDQITELKRLVLLVVRGADDPNTGTLAKMPVPSDKRLCLGALWNDMKKSEGRRLAELKEALADDDVDVDAFVASQKRQRKPYTAEDQIIELKRLVLLVVRGADDPNTGTLAKMPVQLDERLGLGSLWHHMKCDGCRLAELKEALADDDVDVDAFIASQKGKRSSTLQKTRSLN